MAEEEEEPPPLEESLVEEEDDEEDDEPPSLEATAMKQTEIQDSEDSVATSLNADTVEDDEGPSLREIMEQEAAKELKKKETRKKKEKKRMAKSFGKGFKLKGFFNKKKAKKKNPAAAQSVKPKNPDLPYIKRQQDPKGDLNGLRLPEVQEALRNASTQLETDKSWVTEELLENVKKNKTLQKAMTNPNFATLVQAMQTNPQAVAERAKTDPELQEFLSAFTGMMGQHFDKIGAKQDPDKEAEQEKSRKGAAEAELEKRRKNAEMAANDPQVNNVLANEELRAILMDPNMKNILQQCNNPMTVQKYMRDPVIGPKLRLMIQNGLLQFQP